MTAYIEGLSAKAIKTFELGRMDEGQTVHLLPPLVPEQARRITEVQRCTLHCRDLRIDNGRSESHDTYSLVLLARNSSFNSVSTLRPAGPAT